MHEGGLLSLLGTVVPEALPAVAPKSTNRKPNNPKSGVRRTTPWDEYMPEARI